MKTFCFFQVAVVDIFTATVIQVLDMMGNGGKIDLFTTAGDKFNISLLLFCNILSIGSLIGSIVIVWKVTKKDEGIKESIMPYVNVVCHELKLDYEIKLEVICYHVLYTLRRICMVSLLFMT